ncbi:MAG: hypothetical protein AB7F31_02655 [Parachlamydiales bacterium]
MAILIILLAACLASTSNLFMRKSIDTGGSTRAYLVFQLGLSLVVAIFLSPVRTGQYSFSGPAISMGLIGGAILGVMMWSLGKAMEKGPAGLTLASLNSATVMPAIVMALAFKGSWASSYTLWHGIGSALVVVGLFWASWGIGGGVNKRQWALFAGSAFLLHVLLLCLLHWRAMLIKGGTLLPESSQWFNPMIFVAATWMQVVIYLRQEKRRPLPSEVIYGVLGGITNGGCTFFLIVAPEVATPVQNAMIYPLFAVLVIVLSNLWSQALYRERVNWAATALCLGGVILGTVDWSAIG